jgi:hypothetical protein
MAASARLANIYCQFWSGSTIFLQENSQPTNTGDDPQQAEEPQGLEQQLRPTPIVKARTAQR